MGEDERSQVLAVPVPKRVGPEELAGLVGAGLTLTLTLSLSLSCESHWGRNGIHCEF